MSPRSSTSAARVCRRPSVAGDCRICIDHRELPRRCDSDPCRSARPDASQRVKSAEEALTTIDVFDGSEVAVTFACTQMTGHQRVILYPHPHTLEPVEVPCLKSD